MTLILQSCALRLGQVDKRKIVILIAEDEAHIRNALQRNLTKAGYDVILASDGEETMAQFRAYAVDLVVLDIVDELKQLIPDLEFIFVNHSSFNKVFFCISYYSIQNINILSLLTFMLLFS